MTVLILTHFLLLRQVGERNIASPNFLGHAPSYANSHKKDQGAIQSSRATLVTRICRSVSNGL